MPKQSPTQREDREQNLLDAAYRLFMSKGQPKTSIDDIVQEAQVAKGSFYTYFKNKDDLTQKLVDRLCTRILRESYAASRQMPAADFADRVVHLMDQIIEHFKRNKLQLYLIRRNFSWPMVEHELSQPSDPVWQDLASALEHSPLMERYTSEELFRLIFVLVEMCGSICYASIIEGRPAAYTQRNTTTEQRLTGRPHPIRRCSVVSVLAVSAVQGVVCRSAHTGIIPACPAYPAAAAPQARSAWP